jgi:hypothetical protein
MKYTILSKKEKLKSTSKRGRLPTPEELGITEEEYYNRVMKMLREVFTDEQEK